MRVFHTTGNGLLTALLLVVLIFAPLAVPQHRAQADLTDDAIAGAAGCAAAAAIVFGLSKIPALEVPTVSGDDWKEALLDCAAWVINNVIITEITQSTIEWINSGFEGNPGFVENYQSNNQRVFDGAAAAFIHSQELDFICEPFRLNIRLALIDSVGGLGNDFYTRNQCTISRFTDNIQGFLDGDFYNGGWGAWFELTTRPQNNPYGAYLIAQGELARRITADLEEENKKLDWGRGFFPSQTTQECRAYDKDNNLLGTYNPDDPSTKPPGAFSFECDAAQIKTPGSVVEDQLNSVVKLGNERLTVADEFNEVLATLLTYLFTEILAGDGGLRGFDESNIPTVPPIDYGDVIPPVDGGSQGGWVAWDMGTQPGETIRQEGNTWVFEWHTALTKPGELYAGNDLPVDDPLILDITGWTISAVATPDGGGPPTSISFTLTDTEQFVQRPLATDGYTMTVRVTPGEVRGTRQEAYLAGVSENGDQLYVRSDRTGKLLWKRGNTKGLVGGNDPGGNGGGTGGGGMPDKPTETP